eukprot:4044004-Amphidinium_carterae.1
MKCASRVATRAHAYVSYSMIGVEMSVTWCEPRYARVFQPGESLAGKLVVTGQETAAVDGKSSMREETCLRIESCSLCPPNPDVSVGDRMGFGLWTRIVGMTRTFTRSTSAPILLRAAFLTP